MDAKEYLSTSTYAVGDYAKYGGKVYECTTAVGTPEVFDDTKWTQVLSSPSFQTGARTALSLSQGATVPYTAWAVILRNDVNNTDIQSYGYNNYEFSAWRQYLNSDEGLGVWWHGQHVGDCAPAQLASMRGYKAGCSAALLQYAKPIKVPVWPWNKNPQTVTDTFWMASGTEMFGSVNDDEGEPFKGIADNCYSISGWTTPNNNNTAARQYRRVSSPSSSAVTLWLRSAVRSSSNNEWSVNTSGSIGNLQRQRVLRVCGAARLCNLLIFLIPEARARRGCPSYNAEKSIKREHKKSFYGQSRETCQGLEAYAFRAA